RHRSTIGVSFVGHRGSSLLQSLLLVTKSLLFACYPSIELLNYPLIMAKTMAARDQIVKLIVGAGQASPSPPVGPALGSKGVKSMDFCKVRLHIEGQSERLADE